MIMSTGFEKVWIKSWSDWEMWDDVAAFTFYGCTLNPSAFSKEELALAGNNPDDISVRVVIDKFIIEVAVDDAIVITKSFEINPAGTASRLNLVETVLGNVDSALPTGLESFFESDEQQSAYYEG